MNLSIVILADEDEKRHLNCGIISTEDEPELNRMVQNATGKRGNVCFFAEIKHKKLLLTLVDDATVEKGKLVLTKQQCAFAKLKSGDQVELTVCTQPLKVYNKLEVEMELESPAGLTVKPEEPVYAFELAWKVQMTLHEQAVLEGQYMTILNDGIPWLCTIIHGTGGGSTRLKQGVVDYSKTKVFVEITEGQPVIGCGVAKTVLKEKLDVAGVEAKLESMGIVGMTSPILEIIRPAFLSRMMTTGRVMREHRVHKKGMVLYGPPGTGKTLIAKSICKLLNTNEPVVVYGPSLISPLHLDSQQNMFKHLKSAFEEWEKLGPKSTLHILIIEGIDSIVKKSVGDQLNHEDGKNEAQLFALNIFIIGITNQINQINEALFRSGRMELQLSVDLPDDQNRIKMLDMQIQDMGVPLEDSANLQELALMTEGCSGADLTSIINHARDLAVAKPGLLGLAHQSEIAMKIAPFSGCCKT